MNGIDNTGDKPRVELLPMLALIEVAKAMQIGAHDYGERNWEDGLVWGTLSGAAGRHWMAWQSGEDLNDTELNHLAHMAASVLMLLQLQLTGKGDDDRKFRPARRRARLRW